MTLVVNHHLRYDRHTFMRYNDPSSIALAQRVDGVLDEAGFTASGAYHVGKYGMNDWWNMVKWMQLLERQGKSYFSVNLVKDAAPTFDDQEWCLSSFLMGASGRSSIYISPSG